VSQTSLTKKAASSAQHSSSCS